MAKRSVPQIPLAVRFWSKVKKTNTCWLWIGATVPNGYGAFSIRHATAYQAHRVSWELQNGPIPKDMQVCHTCDVRNCVRPSHLFLGTRKDNMQDCAKKGRQSCKLTPEKVRQIRQRYANGESAKALGVDYSVDKSMVHLIVNRRYWDHVD